MNHDEFIEKFKNKQITIQVDRNKAGHFYGAPGLMPQELRKRQALLRTIMFGGILGGVISFFFVKWWIAAGLVFFGFIFAGICQKQAANGVLDASLQNPLVYQHAMENNVFIINQGAQ